MKEKKKAASPEIPEARCFWSLLICLHPLPSRGRIQSCSTLPPSLRPPHSLHQWPKWGLCLCASGSQSWLPPAPLPSRRPSGRINPSGSQVSATCPMERVTRRTPPVPAGGSHQPEWVLPAQSCNHGKCTASGLDRPSAAPPCPRGTRAGTLSCPSSGTGAKGRCGSCRWPRRD